MRWIIGDIHGMLGPLEMLLEAIGRADSAPQLYFVGDYVNRGPDSRGVIELLLRLPGCQFIRGNHDDVFDQVLHGVCYAENASQGNPVIAFQWFLQHGLVNTLLSYGIDAIEIEETARLSSAKRLAAMLAAVPEPHRDFIFNLPPAIEEPDFFIVHGRWHPEDSISGPTVTQQLAATPALRHQILWERFAIDEIGQDKRWDRPGYFGHTAVDCYPKLLGDKGLVPLCGPKLMLLETGIGLSTDGRLTGVCHETGRYIQVDRAGKVLE